MDALISLNIAYFLIVAAVMLAFATILFPRSRLSKIGMGFCLVAGGFELFNFTANPWALLVVAFCPLPFFLAFRQSSPRRPLLIVTAVMLIFGSIFLFVDKNGSPTVNTALLWLVSTICAHFILVVTDRRLNAADARRGGDPDSYIGLIGTATTNVGDVGLVNIEGEICSARSDQSIPAGSRVRVLKLEGRLLVVKKVEKLSGK
jgi:membrane-bound ClpP family serine protease